MAALSTHSLFFLNQISASLESALNHLLVRPCLYVDRYIYFNYPSSHPRLILDARSQDMGIKKLKSEMGEVPTLEVLGFASRLQLVLGHI